MTIDIDVIGNIYTPGTYNAQGTVITTPVQIPGYYVNTTAPVGGWEDFKLADNPANRVFGGTLTHSYKFTDLVEYEAYLATADLTAPAMPPTDIPVINNVPQLVTMRQARLALNAAGLLETVNTAVAASSPEVQIEYEYAATVDRHWPTLAALQTALGMTDAQIDELFRAASQL